ncbi:MAG: selenocysteine-specific translation elongation factor [Clostridia bacterium]|nr:MAG: selenocysteine-specific translation elongation factor [Clostridia bacterium]
MADDFIIVGTAGHVDHGKTVLVRALTGVDTDRLREEKERGISIELGFAPLTLPSGRTLGLVDVPGHERFIRQMLAGAGGMDLVMWVVAADEGVMPQTREHLDIINLLRVKRGVLVLTKVDLVDGDWLDLVEEEVREAVAGTVLEHAPLVRVSAVTGQGIDDLREILDREAAATPPKEAGGLARLPVDRVFKVAGFGTVVTGTLWSGRLKVGQNVALMPQGLITRVRGLQVHGRGVEEGVAGQRVAVNLAGVEVGQLERGCVVTEPGAFAPTTRLDAELYLLPTARALAHRTRVRLYLGTAEAFGRVLLLDRDEMAPGETAFVQLVLEETVVAARGDRFVLRSYSPMTTIGGGEVVEARVRRHKRYRPEVLASLAVRRQGDPAALVRETLAAAAAPVSWPELAERAGIQEPDLRELLPQLVAAGQAEVLEAEGTRLAVAADLMRQWEARLRQALADYHRQYPLRPGLPRESLRSRLFSRLEGRQFLACLSHWEREGRIKTDGAFVFLADFSPRPAPEEEPWLAGVREAYRAGWQQPPDWHEVTVGLPAEKAEELLAYLVRQGDLVKVAEDLYFHREAVEAAQEQIAAYIRQHGGILLGEARDLLASSRKYILPLLEYFDRIKFTKRVGDKRILY